ncbi:hypothetical protein C0J50_2331 [Silurus asotus]|uniref:Reverse transcriptase domain-containing protein n=1 Tax=Silurus asotus TaxID=30991 RepID=A0AAD5FVA3_SILAS|nr:hypothetical protein C0J50_2331 [Silurus asotus]
MVKQEVNRISKEEVRAAIRRMKSGKSVGPDDILVEAWRCLGEMAVDFLTRLFNRILEKEKMPEEWRSVLVPIFKNNGDVQTCSNYRGIKLISHTMKLWERVVEARLREEVTICKQQYGFMPRKSTTDALFALKMLIKKYREVVMDRLKDEVRQESPWTIMFVDDIVICGESREQVEKSLERRRYTLERRGMKVIRIKTEYMYVNEREGSGVVWLQKRWRKKIKE